MRASRRVFIVVLSLVLVVGPSAGPAFAKGSGRTQSSLTLVLVDSSDGLPHYGAQVRFNVSTTATERPYVKLNCYQGEAWVYWASAGYFDDYPWPWTRTFTLSSDYWTAGEADCVAELYHTPDGRRFRTLASTSFHVFP